MECQKSQTERGFSQSPNEKLGQTSPFLRGVFKNVRLRAQPRRQEIERLKAENQRLYDETLRDSLTRLHKKTVMLDRANQRLSNPSPGQLFAFVFIDLDYFKRVNDEHPRKHEEGDRVLVAVAEVLGKITRQDEELPDLLARGNREDNDPARLGGDEFGMFVELTGRTERGTAMSGEERAEAFRLRIVGGLGDLIRTEPEWEILGLGASVTIALRQPGESAEDMLLRADQMQEAVKQAHHAQLGPSRDYS